MARGHVEHDQVNTEHQQKAKQHRAHICCHSHQRVQTNLGSELREQPEYGQRRQHHRPAHDGHTHFLQRPQQVKQRP